MRTRYPAGGRFPSAQRAFGRSSVQRRARIARRREGTVREIPRVMIQSLLLEQAAELLGVSRRTVYYRIRDGRLRTVRARCGSQRVLLESIEELLREQAARLRQRSAGDLAAERVASDAVLLREPDLRLSALAASAGGVSGDVDES